MENNIALILSYLGTNFHGWQQQKNAVTVQETLQNAIFKVTGKRVGVSGCGRTDAGVHARIYVANCHLETTVPMEKLPFALNNYLPNDICVFRTLTMPDSFDSRFSCIKKEYTYHVYANRFKNPLYLNKVGFFPYPLDYDRMCEAAEYFVGTHDFSAVRTIGSNVKTTVRTIYWCDVSRNDNIVSVRVCADGFLYNMVRAITGTLLYAGLGKINPCEISAILESGDRSASGPTVPPDGLYMTGLAYDTDLSLTPDGDGMIRSI